MATLPTFERAAAIQHRYATCYTVWLHGPAGEREYLGFTNRKSGTGLMTFLWREKVQERVKQIPGVKDMGFNKRADRLDFTTDGQPNGWSIRFGDTIRQEAG